ncbi:hypothetical protein ACFL1N_00250 [Thermodesulfobacteriota bacterium]
MADKKLHTRGEKIREKIENAIAAVANVGVVVVLIYVYAII